MSKITGFIAFSNESMQWCKDESEKSISNIMDTINRLSDDATRVSAVSDEALDALKKIKEQVSEVQEKNKVANLSSAVTDFKGKHDGVAETINPIVQSLQFQDRVTQNLDNIRKMIELWWELRNKEATSLELGEKLLEKTTMEDERKIIRSVIPGLPEEEEKKGALLF